MPISKAAAMQLIPRQRRQIEEIIRACEPALRQIAFRNDDSFGLMALCFASKQLDHSRSLIRLLRDPPSRDATVISRLMLEGACCLHWAVCSKADRGDQWLEFAAVEEWRRLNHADRVGLPVTPEERQMILNAARDHGERFFSASGRKKQQHGGSLKGDPYWHSWTGKSFRDLVEETKSGELNVIYALQSHSVHWGPSSVRSYIALPAADTVAYHGISLPEAATAGGWGIICLLQVVGIAAEHFGLKDLAEFIGKCFADYNAWHESVVASG